MVSDRSAMACRFNSLAVEVLGGIGMLSVRKPTRRLLGELYFDLLPIVLVLNEIVLGGRHTECACYFTATLLASCTIQRLGLRIP
jgi:hypothetical protein